MFTATLKSRRSVQELPYAILFAKHVNKVSASVIAANEYQMIEIRPDAKRFTCLSKLIIKLKNFKNAREKLSEH